MPFIVSIPFKRPFPNQGGAPVTLSEQAYDLQV